MDIRLIQILAVILVIFIFGVPKIMPQTMNETEKDYMAHYNYAYELYQNRKCEESLSEFKKAEKIYDKDANLYVSIAYSYECLKDYNSAIKYAKKSLTQKDSKAYRKYHGILYKFITKADISAYTIIGDSSYELKKYNDAKDAYAYVTKHVKYKYTDAYFKKAKCEYYLGETEAALNDFYKHEEIILSYIEDQENSEYKASYPTYTTDDITETDKWIAQTNSKIKTSRQ